MGSRESCNGARTAFSEEALHSVRPRRAFPVRDVYTATHVNYPLLSTSRSETARLSGMREELEAPLPTQQEDQRPNVQMAFVAYCFPSTRHI